MKKNNTVIKGILQTIFVAVLMSSHQAMAATVNLDFVGGCPSPCTATPGGNASTSTLANVLGISESLITEVAHLEGDGTDDGFTINGIGETSGTGSVTLASGINYIALKASNWYAFFNIQNVANPFEWSTDPSMWSPVVGSLICPAEICGAARAYTQDDFMSNPNNANTLSNVRGFQVVPIPPAVLLFVSGLIGMVVIGRRKLSGNRELPINSVAA